MIVDTSALVAICLNEPERAVFLEALLTAPRAMMSSASWLEAAVVLDALHDPVVSRRLDEVVALLRIDSVPLTFEEAQVARSAYADFGKGSGHPARLNFGDAFSYALATVTREPLLFKGEDFGKTDITSAL